MGQIKVNCARVGAIGTNCYIVGTEASKEIVVIDPGDNAQLIGNYIENNGLELKAILLTHAHFDHIGGVPELKERFAVPVYVHELDEPMLADKRKNMGMTEYKLRDDDVRLKDGDVINIAGMEFEVIHTPGHTPGGVCYYIKSENVLFAGDTMFRFSYGRTDFPGGSFTDLMKSIKEKLLPLPEETTVYPGHEGATNIANERITHDYNA